MNIWFSVKEGVHGFKRARLASFITISSIGLSLLLIGLFLVFSVNVNRWIGKKRAKIEIEVYLDPDVSSRQGKQIAKEIKKLEGVQQVKFVSKKQAARQFEQEFGQNVYDVLGTNPLPFSCVVHLQKGFRSSSAIAQISRKIKAIPGVGDVLYEKDLLSLIDHYLTIIYLAALLIGLILIIASVVLLFNTIRLTILARSDIIEIMKLVGATKRFIRRPFLVEGLLQGVFGSLLACGLLWILDKTLQRTIGSHLLMDSWIYIFIVLFGALIGFLSSAMSISKYLNRI